VDRHSNCNVKIGLMLVAQTRGAVWQQIWRMLVTLKPHRFLNSANRSGLSAPTGLVRSRKLAGSVRSKTGDTQLLSTQGKTGH
jgi:hypothetical protein